MLGSASPALFSMWLATQLPSLASRCHQRSTIQMTYHLNKSVISCKDGDRYQAVTWPKSYWLLLHVLAEISSKIWPWVFTLNWPWVFWGAVFVLCCCCNYRGLNNVQICNHFLFQFLPAFLNDDWIWINCLAARRFTGRSGVTDEVPRGVIIVYVSPKEPDELVVKRVIATQDVSALS